MLAQGAGSGCGVWGAGCHAPHPRRPWAGRNGPPWRSERLALNRAVLSPAGARKFLRPLDTVARDFAAALRDRVGRSPGGTLTLDPHPLLFRFTLEGAWGGRGWGDMGTRCMEGVGVGPSGPRGGCVRGVIVGPLPRTAGDG